MCCDFTCGVCWRDALYNKNHRFIVFDSGGCHLVDSFEHGIYLFRRDVPIGVFTTSIDGSGQIMYRFV